MGILKTNKHNINPPIDEIRSYRTAVWTEFLLITGQLFG